MMKIIKILMHVKDNLARYRFTCGLIYLVAIIHPLFLFGEIEYFIAREKSRLPHDRRVFTQGLAIYDNELYESAGLYGQSSLRRIDLRTGQVLNTVALPAVVFAEGLAVNDRFIVQTTWRERKIFIYDRLTFKLLNTLSFTGEAWGLCRDGEVFIMSNGTSKIASYAFYEWKQISEIHAQYGGTPVDRLNDLECVGDSVYANVFGSDVIIKLNKSSGEVTGVIDASSLLSLNEKKSLGREDVLNGIAYNPNSKTFWMTGKRWPWLFEVEFTRSSP